MKNEMVLPGMLVMKNENGVKLSHFHDEIKNDNISSFLYLHGNFIFLNAKSMNNGQLKCQQIDVFKLV